ncbi:MAG: putative C-S lyase [Gammaproteobacteria bacterium]|nr:putative C-S lyase [Gammaproteobacteria bacterium]
MTSRHYNFDTTTERKDPNAVAQHGFKSYIFTEAQVAEFSYPDEELIPLWIADMAFPAAPEIVEAIKQRLDNPIFGYTKILDDSFYRAFVNWTRSRYGWEFAQEELLTTSGVIPALYSLIEYICEADDKVITFTPAYSYFKRSADYHNIDIVYSTLLNEQNEYRMDFNDFRKKASDPKVKVCIFCHPHNPTGRLWTEEELLDFGNICIENNITVISDEIHCDITRAGVVHTPLAKLFPDADNIITCMAPSKTFNLAGFLFANVIIPDEKLRRLWKRKHYLFENPLSLAAAQAAYEEGGSWLSELSTYLDNNFEFVKKTLAKQLPKAVFKVPEATYFAWLDMRAYFPEKENLTYYFAKHTGVIIEGGNMFVADAEGFMRINLACPQSVLKQALERICNHCQTM